MISPGRPLVTVEGELDALLLGQELGNLAAVVTLGSAAGRPDASILGAMVTAFPWFVATDADQAGDKVAAEWSGCTVRVRPPDGAKDWTEFWQSGGDIRRYWERYLPGELAGNRSDSYAALERLAIQQEGEPCPALS
jgi:hypothetical protein